MQLERAHELKRMCVRACFGVCKRTYVRARVRVCVHEYVCVYA